MRTLQKIKLLFSQISWSNLRYILCVILHFTFFTTKFWTFDLLPLCFFSIWETIHQQGKYTFFWENRRKFVCEEKSQSWVCRLKLGGGGEIHYFHVCIWQQFEGQDKDRDWFRSASTLLWLLIYICFKCDFSKSPLTLP